MHRRCIKNRKSTESQKQKIQSEWGDRRERELKRNKVLNVAFSNINPLSNLPKQQHPSTVWKKKVGGLRFVRCALFIGILRQLDLLRWISKKNCWYGWCCGFAMKFFHLYWLSTFKLFWCILVFLVLIFFVCAMCMSSVFFFQFIERLFPTYIPCLTNHQTSSIKDSIRGVRCSMSCHLFCTFLFTRLIHIYPSEDVEKGIWHDKAT